MAPSREEELSAAEVLDRQLQAERAARERFPWDPKECTLYMDIPPRQILFACQTCSPSNAICYSCGIRCHADHEIVELDSKREFRCDCGTAHLTSACRLRETEHDEWANAHLTYNHNFAGEFCVCRETTHDPEYGMAAMFQCLLGTQCGEDWFHARCIAGVSRAEEVQRQQRAAATYDNDDDDDDGDDIAAVFPELPAAFGALICKQCARDVPVLAESAAVAATVNGYIFLKKNYGEIIAADAALARALAPFPFLDGKEETYHPEKDEDEGTLLELGERALGNLPHERVIEGLAAFNSMQARLVEHIRGIAEEGRPISREDIERFFAKR